MTYSVSNVGTISSAGLGSGLDVNTIVTQLMALEQKPLTQLQTQATDLKNGVSTFGKLQSYFSALRDKANALTSPSLWTSTTATSPDTTAVTVSTSATAATGNYAIKTTTLAKGQTVVSSAAASPTINAGTLTIELGTWVTTPAPGFTAKSGASPIAITVGTGETDLASIRDKINAAGAGVVASIVTDATGSRLSIRSQATGAENAFRLSATETADDGDPATGLSALAYDANAASPMTAAQTATNALATINGIDVSSTTNTLDNVIDGLTINLLKETTSPTNVSVANDTAGIKSKITDFVSAFNDLASFMHTQMAYNSDSKTGGTLQGDQTAVQLQRTLRDALNVASTASSAFKNMSDIGITMKADGTLDTNSTKLDNALGNLPELKKLLSADGATTADIGFARRWKNLADVALGSGGAFESRTASLNARLTVNGKAQDAMNQRLAQTEARLRAQYNALDTKMAQLNGLSSYLTQQLTALSKSSSSSS